MRDLLALFRQSLAGLRVLVVATLLLGVAYPLLVTGIAQVAVPWRADGSLVTAAGERTTDADEAVGSVLLGQGVSTGSTDGVSTGSTDGVSTGSTDGVSTGSTDGVSSDGLFQPRPSAAGDGWDGLASGGSNLGPESPELLALVEERRAEVAAREGVDPAAVPPDAVTASGSGLDPHVSPAYAALQVPRVAAANGLDEAAVRALVADHTAGRTLGILGEPRVDVLQLNIAVLAAARDAGAGD